jgi:hypothetical protein
VSSPNGSLPAGPVAVAAFSTAPSATETMSPASPRRPHRGAQQRCCIRKREDPEGSETSHYDRGKRQRDDQRLTGPGQIFRVAMYHENHPDGSNEMCNLVLAFESPRVISWKPGYR